MSSPLKYSLLKLDRQWEYNFYLCPCQQETKVLQKSRLIEHWKHGSDNSIQCTKTAFPHF